MRTSIQTKLFAVAGAVFSIFPVMLIAQTAFDPLFPVGEYCGLLMGWSALAAIAALFAAMLSGACDCFAS